MKYAIVQVVNGNYSITTETADINAAKVQFHNLAAALWNAPDVVTACICILDENLDVVQGYREFISHIAPQPSEG